MKQKHSDKAKNIKLLYLVNGGAMMKNRAYEVKILAIISLKTVAVSHSNNNNRKDATSAEIPIRFPQQLLLGNECSLMVEIQLQVFHNDP